MKPVIVIPCFNDNKFINILIENILSNYNIDIVVIDDGSFTPLDIALSNDSLTLLKNNANKIAAKTILTLSIYQVNSQNKLKLVAL